MSLEAALEALPEANLVLISVAGRYAGDLAMRALQKGLHVMIFSDHVPLETEIELKRFAVKKGLLVMGPDCGTAIINGVPLGFANEVNRGGIGVVAAAGTGLQEVSTIISKQGAGISQAIGTGGRDISREVAGTMFLTAMKALADDRDTEVILLVSKPPHPDVLDKIRSLGSGIKKPVVSLLLGAPPKEGEPETLEEAAHLAVALAKGDEASTALRRLAERDSEISEAARREAAKLEKHRKYIRGLFSGGTFCAEAQVILRDLPSGLYSNVPTGKTQRLPDPLKSIENSLVDMGDDEFTSGRPHPMIDYTLRNKRILEEAADPETAVILLDVVLGYGANMDPAGELVPIIREAARTVCVVCSVTGTPKDPQDAAKVTTELTEAGALVMPSNAAACKMAREIVRIRE
jgi:FdrA protein